MFGTELNIKNTQNISYFIDFNAYSRKHIKDIRSRNLRQERMEVGMADKGEGKTQNKRLCTVEE